MPGHFDGQEVRREPHQRCGAVAFGKGDVAFDPDQPLQACRAGMPQHTTFEHAAPEQREVFARQRTLLVSRQLRKAQGQVAPHHAAAAAHRQVQQMAEAAPQHCQHRQRQPVQQPYHRQQQVSARVAQQPLHAATSAWRGCL
jgi:hypothetical protein